MTTKICPNCHMDVSVHERYGMCPVVGVPLTATADCFLHGSYDPKLFNCPHPDHKRQNPSLSPLLGDSNDAVRDERKGDVNGAR